MKIIKTYWSNEEEGKKQEFDFLQHIQEHEIKKVFVGLKEIKNFKIEIDKNNRMILRYALTKNASLKYYCNLLNHAIALNKNTAIFLQDNNYLDYKNQTLTEETKILLNS